jgi:replicative superfamily II helicase/DNA-binding winged helix-turn-helix (wHTH) protein
LAGQVLTVAAARRRPAVDEVKRRMNGSLVAQLRWHHELTAEEISAKLDIAVNEAVAAKVIGRRDDGTLEVTPYGSAVVQHGISLATAAELRAWVAAVRGHAWHDADALTAVALTENGRMTFVTLTGREYNHAGYFDAIGTLVDGYDDTADTALNRLRRSDMPPLFDEMKAVKAALILIDWIGGAQIRDIEDRYRTMSGQVTPAAEQAAWLVNATGAIAATMAVPAEFRDRLDTLATRLAHGVTASGVALARLGVPGLTRNHIAALVTHGITSVDSLCRYPLGDLVRLIPKSVVGELNKVTQGPDGENASNPQAEQSVPAIEIHANHPGSVRVDGHEIALPKKQFCLLAALAASPGRCVPYDTIYTALWGENVIVQPAQINQHKCKLLQKLAEVHPRFATAIRTVPKHGFTLELPLHDIRLIT